MGWRERHVCLQSPRSCSEEGETNNSDVAVQFEFIPNWKFLFPKGHSQAPCGPSEPYSVSSLFKLKKEKKKLQWSVLADGEKKMFYITLEYLTSKVFWVSL